MAIDIKGRLASGGRRTGVLRGAGVNQPKSRVTKNPLLSYSSNPYSLCPQLQTKLLVAIGEKIKRVNEQPMPVQGAKVCAGRRYSSTLISPPSHTSRFGESLFSDNSPLPRGSLLTVSRNCGLENLVLKQIDDPCALSSHHLVPGYGIDWSNFGVPFVITLSVTHSSLCARSGFMRDAPTGRLDQCCKEGL